MTLAQLMIANECVLWTSTVAYAVLAFVLWKTQLSRRYRFFFAFVLFRMVRALALSLTAENRFLYANVWGVTQPLLWIFYILVVLELYGLVLESYKGLATVGRWAMMIGLGLAVSISLLSLGADFATNATNPKYPRLVYWFVIDRGVQSAILLFLLFITVFLAWYPVRLSRNVIVHCVIYAAYFLTGAMGGMVRNFWGTTEFVRQSVNLSLSSATLLCLIAWIVFLRPQGEQVTIAKRPQWSPEDEAHLISQLASINASLLRAARK